MKFIKNFVLNFGPQHPATHGVLRLVLELDGEYIDNVYCHIGFLHRGSEKLSEYKNYLQILPYLDRLDYVSTLNYEHVYSLLLEKISNIQVDLKTSLERVILLELSRILNHLLAITTHAIDVGAATPFLWGFEEREKIMEILEECCGARLHVSYIVPSGLNFTLKKTTLIKVVELIRNLFSTCSEIDLLLTKSRVWQQRLQNVGFISFLDSLNWGFSGVMLRSCGVDWDLRVQNTYECYDLLNFNVILGSQGDCYDRYLVRLYELFESLNIIYNASSLLLNLEDMFFLKRIKINSVDNFFIKDWDKDYANNISYNFSTIFEYSMESLIEHFLLNSEGTGISGDLYCCTECPKGEFGIYLKGLNFLNPVRFRLRAPGFFHLQALRFLTQGHQLADLVTILGSIDLVLGEVDR